MPDISFAYGMSSLKSNMDRFIDGKIQQSRCNVYSLKSNMDRFIVAIVSVRP